MSSLTHEELISLDFVSYEIYHSLLQFLIRLLKLLNPLFFFFLDFWEFIDFLPVLLDISQTISFALVVDQFLFSLPLLEVFLIRINIKAFVSDFLRDSFFKGEPYEVHGALFLRDS